jgi:transmembrane sensor
MDEFYYHKLAGKWLNGTITDVEKKEFSSWYEEKGIKEKINIPEGFVIGELHHSARIWERIQERNRVTKRSKSIFIYKLSSAAAIIASIIGLGYWILSNNDNVKETKATVQSATYIKPGSDKAVLTLSDGRKLMLNDSSTENISDTYTLINNKNGTLAYNSKNNSIHSTIGYNTMTTPRGGQYRIMLPDGTKVWLNSDSYIKYPTVFTGNARTVTLSGEAFFDVKENTVMPFIVKTNEVDISVLGTAFNVNCYNNESDVSTTLINGSVKVTSENSSKIIKPGQQVQLFRNNPGHLKLNDNVDVSQVIAWQKGLFEFNSTNLQSIAKQLSRWYDVDIVADAKNNDFTFSGGINKKTPLNDVLKILDANGIKHKWEPGMLKLYIQ